MRWIFRLIGAFFSFVWRLFWRLVWIAFLLCAFAFISVVKFNTLT